MHDVVIVGVPLIAILAGVLFNRSDSKELRSEMIARFNRVDARFNKVEDHLGRIGADLRQFDHLTGKLEARMDSLESAANSLHLVFAPDGSGVSSKYTRISPWHIAKK